MSYGIEITKALTDKFEQILTGHKITWQNRPAPNVNNSNWLEFTIMTGGTFGQSISHSDRVNGLVQIDCYMPEYTGEDYAFTVADLLNTNLPKNGEPIIEGSTKVFFNYVKQPRLSQDPNWHRMIIEVSYYAFVPRI